jgi:hypothetical protein
MSCGDAKLVRYTYGKYFLPLGLAYTIFFALQRLPIV